MAPSLETRALAIFAKSIVRELRAQGYGKTHVIALAGELLDIVTKEVEDQRSEQRKAGQA